MNKFRREIQMIDPFDKRDDDPKKNYGISALQIRMLLHGEHATMQFLFSTGMHLPNVMKENLKKGAHLFELLNRPMGYDVGYHADVPQWEGHEPMEKCDVRPQGTCYYDGSSLQADNLLKVYFKKGQDAVWKKLEQLYKELKKPEKEKTPTETA